MKKIFRGKMKKITITILFALFSFVTVFTQTPQEKTATVFGAKIRYLEAGDPTKPTIILLHGMGGRAEFWGNNMSALSAQYRVIAPDQIGFGKSDKPLLAYRIGTFVDFLDKFLSELKIEKASLIGNSLGGWIALDFAIKHPEKTEKLILANSSGYAYPQNYDFNILQNLNAATRHQARGILKLVFYNQSLITDTAVESLLAQRVTANDGHTIQAVIESIKRGEDFIDGRLNLVKSPTLIIWGKDDKLIPLSDANRFNKEIANSKLIVFEQCGHLPQFEKDQEFNKNVLEFLGN